jgi:hypothetical protein
MPRIAKISVDYSDFSDFEDANKRKSNKPVNTLTLARYCLYNRDVPGFGLNDGPHLAYNGGFITQESKINTKYSDLQIKRSSTNNGNLYVSGSSIFFRGISLGRNSSLQPTSNIKNARRIENINELVGNTYDRDPLTIKDFKNFMYHPGMITLYNGTWEDVRDKMPFWRICALPDAGKDVVTTTPEGESITIKVPNLLGKFFPGSQPTDVTSPTGEYDYKSGNNGGHDAIKLIADEMPTHNHNVQVTWSGDTPPVISGLGSFIYGGGELNVSRTSSRSCLERGASIACGCSSQCNTRCLDDDCDSTSRTHKCHPIGTGALTPLGAISTSTVTSLNIESYSFRTLRINTELPKITLQTQQTIGANGQHENRPQFFGLVPIIYVGVKR